jgi:hypothetical protein
MAGKIIVGGTPIDFTCENHRFKTDISAPINPVYPGSVTFDPIYDGGDDILLLEKVIEKSSGNKCYWFMWYSHGIPKLTMSGVISEDDIAEVIRNISKISF